jgi:hypothetical protein
MPVSAIPDLLNALYATGKTELPDAIVSYGIPATMQTGDTLMVGVDAVDVLDAANSASSQQEIRSASTQHPRYESGAVTLAALSWNGDTGDAAQKTAVEGVFAIASVVADAIRADPTLGLADQVGSVYPFFTVEYGTDHRLMTSSDETGTAAWLIFTVSFSTRV